MDTTKTSGALAALLLCLAGPCLAADAPFPIGVDLKGDALTEAVALAVPKGAEAASDRYFRLAEKTHPVLLAHGFAAVPDEEKEPSDDDPLGELDPGLVEADSIQRLDKDVEFVVRASGDRRSFVLMIVNRGAENKTASVELKRGKMREPVYRRVYSEDGGKTWTTMAWQPPRSSDVYPWTVEVPANTVQTVTITVK